MPILQLAPVDFADWCQANTNSSASPPLLIDVREPWEVATASVSSDAAAFHLLTIPMGEIASRMEGLQDEYPASQPIACLCHHGMRSQRVAAFLAGQGFTNIVNIQGGIDAWSRQVDSQVPIY